MTVSIGVATASAGREMKDPSELVRAPTTVSRQENIHRQRNDAGSIVNMTGLRFRPRSKWSPGETPPV